MKKIKILPPQLIAKIAAGEVVERPVSVIKELVDNALDAKAKHINIRIEKSGFKKITVTDDGFGMDYDNIQKCFKPHATNKIKSAEDLTGITSLGFRGEALSSIAAVSQIIIKSKTPKQKTGTQIILDGKKIKNISPLGMPTGTQIIVKSLFKNTPARKKFLRSPQTEFQYIMKSLTRTALAFPEIGFSLKHNKKTIFKLPKGHHINERMQILLGKRIYSHLLPIKASCPYFQLQGFIGTPQIALKNNSKQYIFVNGRQIKNTPIAFAIKQAYGTLLSARTHPMFLLSLTLPFESVDVNIHPRKEEVKFLHHNQIINSIQKTVEAVLQRENLTYQGGNFREPMEQSTADALKDATELWDLKEKKNSQIIQIHNNYLVTQTKSGLLIIDQHAAHERILYEQLKKTFAKLKKEKNIYQLRKAIVFDLPLADVSLLKENLKTLKKLGFDIEPFGRNTFKINAVPALFKKRDIVALINELIEDLNNNTNAPASASLDEKSEQTINYLACRSAIKSGDSLSPRQRKKLVQKLQQTQTQYTCPHGRPVQIEISKKDLDLMFKRK